MEITPFTSKIDNKLYKLCNGTYYHRDTTDAVIKVLENCRVNNVRMQFFYGDSATGRDWNEENDTIGYIGRSCGQIKIPLLIKTASSMGGSTVLDHCILKIRETKTKKVLYVSSNYQSPVIDIVDSDLSQYAYNTVVNGQTHGRHKTLRSAQLLKSKLQ